MKQLRFFVRHHGSVAQVMTMERPIENVSDVLTRGNLSRHYEPADFRAILDEAENEAVAQSLVRRALRRLDGGRFRPMVDEAHNMMAHSDLEGQRHFAAEYPRLLEWASVFGEAEHLATFAEYLPDDATDAKRTAADGGASEQSIKPNYGTFRGL